MSKPCKACQAVKTLSEYYRHDGMADGHLNKCKSCTKERARDRRLENPEATRIKERDRGRERLKDPARIAAIRAYAQTEGGKAARIRARRKYNERNPVKRDARNKVAYALKRGKLQPQPCEKCGEGKAQAHHDDYAKPLVVRWLCTTHHAEWHRDNTPLNG